jgi:signal transduction histidine kinase
MFTPLAKRDKLVISVIDSGVGIKAKDKIRLFKLFGCLNNTRQMNT